MSAGAWVRREHASYNTHRDKEEYFRTDPDTYRAIVWNVFRTMKPADESPSEIALFYVKLNTVVHEARSHGENIAQLEHINSFLSAISRFYKDFTMSQLQEIGQLLLHRQPLPSMPEVLQNLNNFMAARHGRSMNGDFSLFAEAIRPTRRRPAAGKATVRRLPSHSEIIRASMNAKVEERKRARDAENDELANPVTKKRAEGHELRADADLQMTASRPSRSPILTTSSGLHTANSNISRTHASSAPRARSKAPAPARAPTAPQMSNTTLEEKLRHLTRLTEGSPSSSAPRVPVTESAIQATPTLAGVKEVQRPYDRPASRPHPTEVPIPQAQSPKIAYLPAARKTIKTIHQERQGKGNAVESEYAPITAPTPAGHSIIDLTTEPEADNDGPMPKSSNPATNSTVENTPVLAGAKVQRPYDSPVARPYPIVASGAAALGYIGQYRQSPAGAAGARPTITIEMDSDQQTNINVRSSLSQRTAPVRATPLIIDHEVGLENGAQPATKSMVTAQSNNAEIQSRGHDHITTPTLGASSTIDFSAKAENEKGGFAAGEVNGAASGTIELEAVPEAENGQPVKGVVNNRATATVVDLTDEEAPSRAMAVRQPTVPTPLRRSPNVVAARIEALLNNRWGMTGISSLSTTPPARILNQRPRFQGTLNMPDPHFGAQPTSRTTIANKVSPPASTPQAPKEGHGDLPAQDAEAVLAWLDEVDSMRTVW